MFDESSNMFDEQGNTFDSLKTVNYLIISI